jgi:hypothetical protein
VKPHNGDNMKFELMREPGKSKQAAMTAVADATAEPAYSLCPRCAANPADRRFLGSEQEGFICALCWVRELNEDSTS